MDYKFSTVKVFTVAPPLCSSMYSRRVFWAFIGVKQFRKDKWNAALLEDLHTSIDQLVDT